MYGRKYYTPGVPGSTTVANSTSSTYITRITRIVIYGAATILRPGNTLLYHQCVNPNSTHCLLLLFLSDGLFNGTSTLPGTVPGTW